MAIWSITGGGTLFVESDDGPIGGYEECEERARDILGSPVVPVDSKRNILGELTWLVFERANYRDAT